MSSRKLDLRVRSLMGFHGADGDPADLIGRLCAELLNDAGASLPVDLEVLASFRNAYVNHVNQEQPETIHWDGRNFQIRVRNADTPGRQRFSCAHAIVHTWFLESSGAGQYGPAAEQSWSEEEEDLCDLGASALVLPEAAFRTMCPPDVTMDDILELADKFQASAEATALRAVTLSSTPLAMVVLEMMLKPVEQRALASRLPSADLLVKHPPIAPRLRVVKGFGQRLGFLPRYKSVGVGTPLESVLEDGHIDYVGEIGILPGTYRVSARNLPIKRGGQRVDRVLALIAAQG